MAQSIRLDKYLADAGKGTRSQVKAYIKKGMVFVNGQPAKCGDIKIDTENDTVLFDGQQVEYKKYVYYMLHKPAGVVSATTDNRDKTVVELITADKRRDLFPVGRLDKDTEGLLIITNDGKLASSLLSPKKHVGKKYFAILDKEACEQDIVSFAKGLDIGDERDTLPAILTIDMSDRRKVVVEITEGRYHQVKRMFNAVGKEVTYLKRLSMGGIYLDEKLKAGDFRELTDEELMILKNQKSACI